jgi:hypothetical protein
MGRRQLQSLTAVDFQPTMNSPERVTRASMSQTSQRNSPRHRKLILIGIGPQ